MILTTDALSGLATLDSDSVHCVVTSPPYWGLRDYGVEGQLGLEKTPEEYVAKMVEVFREVRRVLRGDGTCWVNLGSSYAAGGHGGHAKSGTFHGHNNRDGDQQPKTAPPGYKPKDMVPTPWLVALALQADGWYLRQDIIWAKPNPMPESVTDRCTKAHEYLFLLTKQARYYYDAEAVREAVTASTIARLSQPTLEQQEGSYRVPGKTNGPIKATGGIGGRNRRSVWTIPTQSFSAAHFATFPTALVEPCILAGTSEKGCCPECGAPWKRVIEKTYNNPGNRTTNGPRSTENRSITAGFEKRLEVEATTTGWIPTCDCYGDWTDTQVHATPKRVPCTVLDPFLGSGTVAQVARWLRRNYIGIELNSEYVEIARKRINMPREPQKAQKPMPGQMDLFA